MDNIYSYANYINDITSAMLEQAGPLSQEQQEFLRIIRRNNHSFANAFFHHSSGPVEELRRYLSHDALSPVTTVIGYSDLMLTLGDLPPAYEEAIGYIRQCGHALHSELVDLHDQVREFMVSIGLIA